MKTACRKEKYCPPKYRVAISDASALYSRFLVAFNTLASEPFASPLINELWSIRSQSNSG